MIGQTEGATEVCRPFQDVDKRLRKMRSHLKEKILSTYYFTSKLMINEEMVKRKEHRD